MASLVLCGLREDDREGMNTLQLVIINDHEDRDKLLLDGKEVNVGWLPFKRGEGVRGLFEEAGDSVRRHVTMRLAKKLLRSRFLGYRQAVENCDDDDHSDCVGEGKLRVLGAFGDSAESVGSRGIRLFCSAGSLFCYLFCEVRLFSARQNTERII